MSLVCPQQPPIQLEQLKDWARGNYGANVANREPWTSNNYLAAGIIMVGSTCKPIYFGSAAGINTFTCETHGIFMPEKPDTLFIFNTALQIGFNPYCQPCGSIYPSMESFVEHLRGSQYCLTVVHNWPEDERHPLLRGFAIPNANGDFDQDFDDEPDDDDGEGADFLDDEVTEADLIAHHQEAALAQANALDLQNALEGATFATITEEEERVFQPGQIAMPDGKVLAWDETTQQYLVQ
jgi:hypothetical protein